jgi:hypothetical protein
MENLSLNKNLFLNQIEDYQINDDGSFDVFGDVGIFGVPFSPLWQNIRELPISFNEVSGYFFCEKTNITTLKGCPKKVNGFFSFSQNNFITSLEGLEDSYIGGILDVSGCMSLYSLKGFPKKVDDFDCRFTPIYPIYETFIQECDYETIRKFNDFNVILNDDVFSYIDYDNLGKFLRSVGKEDLMMSKEDFVKFISNTEYKWDY